MTMGNSELRFDTIGYWSEVKLDIVKEYACAYSKILSAQKGLTHIYIDAFAGAGVHISKTSGNHIPGSPLNALEVSPPFKEFHFVDLDHARVENLRSMAGGRADVTVHEGDSNKVLLETILPRARYENYRRALCLLDPYGLTLDWRVIERAGKMRSVDMFLNFPVMDMNRNALWSDARGVDPADAARMTTFWGEDTWKQIAYQAQGSLFGGEDLIKHGGNSRIVEAFKKRLKDVAGFKNVLDPMPMRIPSGAIVYYLFFASQKDVANKLVRHVFNKHADRKQ